MGKKRGRKGESIMGYFRPYFEREPSLVHEKGNDQLIEYWKRDHPGYTTMDLKRVRQNLSNLKSSLRRDGRRKGRKRVPAAYPVNETPAFAAVEPVGPTLVTLEGVIDDCLILAKRIDRTELADVIQSLRRARNEVVNMLD